MRILVLSQYFWPEEFLINDFALSLRDRGHEVEVLTGLPNYPHGRFFAGYTFRGPYKDDYHGIPVWRSPLIPRGNSSGARLAVNYLSFALLACLRGILSCRRRFDVILVFEVSPVTVGIPARVLKRISGAKVFFWVQDLWPESLSATGAVKSPTVLAWTSRMTRWIYRGCDRILVQSEAFRPSIHEQGVEPSIIRYFPNFAEDLYQPTCLDDDAPERKLVPPGFRIMFAGNIGVSQDFSTILAAAELTRGNPEIQWVIIGDGRVRPWVESEIRQRSLSNVHLLGRHPKERMPAFFSLADVMLVSLKRDPIFALTIPSKVQAYLACGKPMIASMDGEGARIVLESESGLAVPSENPAQLARAVCRLAEIDRDALKTMGRSARSYYESHFSRSRLADRFDELLHETCGKTTRQEVRYAP